MTEYLNLNGNSGIVAYEIRYNEIDIQFGGGATYTYAKKHIGDANFEAMKTLAEAGVGLNAFINRCVRNLYKRISEPQPTVNMNAEEVAAMLTDLMQKHGSVKISLQ